MTSSFLRFWIRKWLGEHLSPCPGTHPAKSDFAHGAHASQGPVPRVCPIRSPGLQQTSSSTHRLCCSHLSAWHPRRPGDSPNTSPGPGKPELNTPAERALVNFQRILSCAQ